MPPHVYPRFFTPRFSDLLTIEDDDGSVNHSNVPMRQSEKPSSGQSNDFKFVVINHHEQLKDQQVMRQNHQHVMRNYLRREQRNPDSTDVHVHGGSQARKKRKGELSAADHSDVSAQVFICFTADYLGINLNTAHFPLSRFGGEINQLNIWPAFSRPGLDVGRLKYLYSQRFGSASISELRIPLLLRHRHTFLSTVCVSATYDDIVRRATGAAEHQRIVLESIKRTEERSEVVAMINEHLSSPALGATDRTIGAVLQVLDIEVMAGNERVLDVHQKGLRQFVAMRGGLQGLEH